MKYKFEDVLKCIKKVIITIYYLFCEKLIFFFYYMGLLVFAVLIFFGFGNHILNQIEAKNYDLIFQFIQINLSLFGFCFIANVLSEKSAKKNNTELKIFNIGTGFLCVVILFLITIASATFSGLDSLTMLLKNIYHFTLYFGLFVFIFSLIIMIDIINKHLVKGFK
ncbi:MAG: hypothetical protein V1859_06010 [archaeon]